MREGACRPRHHFTRAELSNHGQWDDESDDDRDYRDYEGMYFEEESRTKHEGIIYHHLAKIALRPKTGDAKRFAKCHTRLRVAAKALRLDAPHTFVIVEKAEIVGIRNGTNEEEDEGETEKEPEEEPEEEEDEDGVQVTNRQSLDGTNKKDMEQQDYTPHRPGTETAHGLLSPKPKRRLRQETHCLDGGIKDCQGWNNMMTAEPKLMLLGSGQLRAYSVG
ncbi:MAG: hypothetical protein Q9218_003120 [Villophora microphyllina]